MSEAKNSRARRKRKLGATVKAAIRGEVEEPQVAQLISEFTRIAGGIRGVAKMLFDSMNHPGTTAAQKHRILQLVLYGMKFSNTQKGPRDQLGLVSDEDLERLAVSLLDKMKAADAPKEATPDA